MLRKLGTFEKAMLISNQHAPFNVISVLRMENAPSPDIVKRGLEILQKRQPFLRARIVSDRFENVPDLELIFTHIKRTSDLQWQSIAEQEMTFRFDHTVGPLLRATYLHKEGYGDLVLNAHHDIMDAGSGMNFLHELLQLCDGELMDLPALELAPAMEQIFPSSHQGLQKIINLIKYTLAQMGDMGSYMWRNRGKRIPPVQLGGKGHIATTLIPEEMVNRLSQRARRKGITLNSLLNAALVLAVNRQLYNGQAVVTRTFSFADLRPYTHPPTPPEPLANYIALLGFTIDVSGAMDIWTITRDLHGKIYHSLKHGDKFSAALTSKSLLNMVTKTKSMRFGATALNYSGKVPLKPKYGNIQITGLHGFVSGYDLGPEMASQARLFNDQIWWDFIYLDTDMGAEIASRIISEVLAILEEASQGAD